MKAFIDLPSGSCNDGILARQTSNWSIAAHLVERRPSENVLLEVLDLLVPGMTRVSAWRGTVGR